MKRTHYATISVSAYAGLEPRQFSYTWPEETPPVIGQLVRVPFGKEKSLGVVVGVSFKPPVAKSRMREVETILPYPALPAHTMKLAEWLQRYYAASNRAVWQSLIPSQLPIKGPRAIAKSMNKNFIQDENIKLTLEQQVSFDMICKSTKKPTLIYGITGSGKTRLYEALIAKTLAENRSVIILAPEIILATHLGQRLQISFGKLLHATHSGLTAGQRRAVWLHALASTTAEVYLGPRSALFLPIHNLGLIIVDEEHDSSYKQEQQPRFQATFVAAQLARITKAKLVLGSATPSLQTLALVKRGYIQQTTLSQRYGDAGLPAVHIIQAPKSKSDFLAPELHAAINQRLEKGQQSILLHNQRGSARKLLCTNCAETVRCSFCDTPMVFHADEGRLICHVCDRQQAPPALCSSCGAAELHYSGFGTKALTEHLRKRFPQARVARLDRDSREQDGLEDTLKAMHKNTIDILVGTQMIAKGLDFPHVSLVGIVAADELLAGTDFASAERGTSLIMQAAGRPGRRDTKGDVYIQTYNPDRAIFDQIKNHDWLGFAESEQALRHRFHYPPSRWLLRLSLSQPNEAKLERESERYAALLRTNPQLNVLGPAVPTIARQGKQFWRQIVVTAADRQLLVDQAASLPRGWIADLDPISIL